MQRFLRLAAALLVSVSGGHLAGTAWAGEGYATPAFDVPRLDGITVDGEPSDWPERGFFVHVMMADTGRPADAVTGGGFRLAWDDRGLLFVGAFKDDVGVESSSGSLWAGDGVELFFTPTPGHQDMVQIILAPGTDPEQNGLRVQKIDKRQNEALKGTELQLDAACTTDGADFVIEARLPWTMLGIEPSDGAKAGLQVIHNDADVAGERTQRSWHPNPGTWADSGLTQAVRLSVSPSESVRAVASVRHERLRRLRVDVAGTADLAGAPVQIFDGDTLYAEATLETDGNAATARLRRPTRTGIPLPTALIVRVNGLNPLFVAVPNVAKAAADETLEQPLVASESFIFHGRAFPTIDFAQPSLMEDALGPYKVATSYFNADHEPVTIAENPGRYGAVIRFETEDGRTLTRYRTLYRTPDHIESWKYELDATIRLPEHYGVTSGVNTRWQENIAEAYKWSFVDGAKYGPMQSLTLAGLTEMDADNDAPPSVYDDPWSRDRQWWVDHKRLLNGNAERYPDPFPGPRTLNGESAPVLREGTPVQAGMDPGVVEQLDALLTEWAENSDEAFIACVARRGVVVLHKAYGTRDGEPMTTDTKSYMASLSKLVSGTQVMMAVDAGLLDLDEPITTYLPEVRDADFTTVPTLRHLYTHTAGMSTHRGESDHDLEHLVAEYAPHFPVGQKYGYNGMSLELGLKILEQVTGQAYPAFAQQHLLGPLGCTNTEALNASWNTESTAYDMALIGQMLLNRGAYGSLRFMSEDTFAQMLPQSLTATLGPDTPSVYGIGCSFESHDGLSDACFGHGAASSATLRIDPELELVISMTRDSAGEKFNEYHPRFIQTVVDAITDR